MYICWFQSNQRWAKCNILHMDNCIQCVHALKACSLVINVIRWLYYYTEHPFSSCYIPQCNVYSVIKYLCVYLHKTCMSENISNNFFLSYKILGLNLNRISCMKHCNTFLNIFSVHCFFTEKQFKHCGFFPLQIYMHVHAANHSEKWLFLSLYIL